MDEVRRINTEFGKLRDEFNSLTSNLNKSTLSSYSWKFYDFVIGIDTKRSYSPEEKQVMRDILGVIKKFIKERINTCYEYLSEVVEKKTQEVNQNTSADSLGSDNGLSQSKENAKSLTLTNNSAKFSHPLTEGENTIAA